MVHIKSRDEIERIRECGIISSNLFKELGNIIKEGMTTKELDKFAEDYIKKNKAIPSFKGYSGYPASLCTSVNDEIIHGIPSNRKLKKGDIVGIDVGIKKNGLISDSATTFKVGHINHDIEELMQHTEQALFKAIFAVANNVQINDVSGAVEDYIRPLGYGIVNEYCGHGVGYRNHEDPEVPNYRFAKGRRRLKSGTVIAIEPMINLGDEGCYVLNDGWTVVTADGKASAHFEHTVAVTDEGYDILTIHPDELEDLKKKFS